MSLSLVTTTLMLHEVIQINSDNHRVQQTVDIPVLPAELFVSAEGDGCALMQVR
jgi:hypothetical protein